MRYIDKVAYQKEWADKMKTIKEFSSPDYDIFYRSEYWFYLTGTDYALELLYDNDVVWYKDINKCRYIKTFEEVLADINISDDIKTTLLFHLDLFI